MNDKLTEALKPCPFCGGPAKEEEQEFYDGDVEYAWEGWFDKTMSIVKEANP